MQHAVIAATVRTPIGNLNGALSSMSATELGSCAIRESMHRAAIAPEDVDEVIRPGKRRKAPTCPIT